MRTTIIFFALTLSALCAGAKEYKVIVNEKVNVDSIKLSELRAIYGGDKSYWPDGARVRVARMSDETSLMKDFAQEVMKTSVADYIAYWRHKLFAGRALPPKKVSSKEEMAQFVKEFDGAIGFLPANENNPPGTKAINVTE